MATYYVHSPDLGMSGEVEADSKRHAETAFTQYLSRNGIVKHGSIGYYKDNFKSFKMEPGEIVTDIQLDYDMSDGEVRPRQAPIRSLEEPTIGDMPRMSSEEPRRYEVEDYEESSTTGMPSPLLTTRQVPSPLPTGQTETRLKDSVRMRIAMETSHPEVSTISGRSPSSESMTMRQAGPISPPTPMEREMPGGLKPRDPIEEAQMSPIGRISKTIGHINPILQRSGI